MTSIETKFFSRTARYHLFDLTS